MTREVTEHGPYVHKRISVSWNITERWGSQLGDVREYSITRAGDRIVIRSSTEKRELTLQLDTARKILSALGQAIDFDIEGNS